MARGSQLGEEVGVTTHIVHINVEWQRRSLCFLVVDGLV